MQEALARRYEVPCESALFKEAAKICGAEAPSRWRTPTEVQGLPLPRSGPYRCCTGHGQIPRTRRIMSVDTFEASLHQQKPPEDWSPALQALWWDACGDWERAHSLVQLDEADRQCAWVHAYLHWKEGDLSNAAYW